MTQDLRRLGAQLLRANERNERLVEGLLVLAEADRPGGDFAGARRCFEDTVSWLAEQAAGMMTHAALEEEACGGLPGCRVIMLRVPAGGHLTLSSAGRWRKGTARERR